MATAVERDMFPCMSNIQQIVAKTTYLNASYTFKAGKEKGIILLNYLSHVVRKPVFGFSDEVQHKSSCTATEDG